MAYMCIFYKIIENIVGVVYNTVEAQKIQQLQ